jgi:hypothetical protein
MHDADFGVLLDQVEVLHRWRTLSSSCQADPMGSAE